jgi:outer membrane lipoprotein carrier protein
MITRTSWPLSGLAFATLLAVGAAPAPAQQGAIPVLEAAAARYRASSALCADFVQDRSIPLLGEKRSGRGRLCQKQPNLFMMRFTDPQGDLVIADGVHFWQYTPSTDPRQAIQARMESVGGAFDFHREFLENPGEKYEARLDGQEAIDGNGTHRVVLVPRRPAGFREAVLWIDVGSSLVRRVEVREENGSVTTVSLSGIDLNATPSADLFRFTPPAGVEILRP